jgi:hypothetical protein
VKNFRIKELGVAVKPSRTDGFYEKTNVSLTGSLEKKNLQLVGIYPSFQEPPNTG